MKKLCTYIVISLNFIFVSLVFAQSAANIAGNTTVNKNYFSAKSTNKLQQINKLSHPPTDITLINASADVIYANVPNTPINDIIYPTDNDHIYNNFGAYYTSIILRDPNYNIFFNNIVCPLAVITIYGSPGSYQINIDSDLCL